MKYTIEHVSKHHCYGCEACASLCPSGAIRMQENDEGFFYPIIDGDKCIKCSLCYKKCPSVNFTDFGTERPTVYAMMAKDDIRKTSSSGGMMSCIAKYVFALKGVVCGVKRDADGELKFAFARNMEELEPIKGSKYYQAKIGNTYVEIKKLLDGGTTVFFGACPCQVAGLKNYLSRDYKNLITADVVCHGVPSKKAVDKYVETLSDLDDVRDLRFRDKELYKWSSSITLDKKSGQTVRKHYNDASFYKAFGNGLGTRESCYNCKFAQIPRVGDFTLADYWHISEFNPSVNDWMGTSCVLLNTDKAKKIYAEIESEMKKSVEMPLETATKYNSQLKHPIQRHPARDTFYGNIFKTDFDTATEKALDRAHFDVGITGYWYATNYGSVLTYYALYKAIEDMGYKTVILDRPDKHLDGEPQTVFSRVFMNKFANVSDSYSYFEQGRYSSLCDKFVIGSDQVWTPHAIMDTGYRFFLDFVSEDKTKVAYACSFGQDSFNALPETKQIVSYLLSRFDAISVREDTGIDVCKREFNIDAVQMIDPIFLKTREFYERIADYSNKNEGTSYMLSYILDPDEDKRRMLLDASSKKGLKLINVLDGRYNTADANLEKLNLPSTYHDIYEEEWISLFRDAEFVVTDSHHGFAMAVIFNKPVICIMNRARGGTRFTSLLGWLGMTDRLIDKTENLKDKPYLLADGYDYTPVNAVIDKKRKESLDWLSSALSAKHGGAAGLYDFVNSRIKEFERKISDLRQKNSELEKQINELIAKGEQKDG